MGLLSLATSIAGGAGGLAGSIKKALDKTKSNNNTSSSGSSGGVASSITNSLRDYMSLKGQPIEYDASSGMVTLGGKQYAAGSIPGTTYNQTTGQHYVTDPNALNNALNLVNPQQQLQQQQLQLQQNIPNEYINGLKIAQKQARLASLDKAREGALASLDIEKASVAPTYYDARNRAAAQSDVGAMNFAQYMAARGIKGAAGAMPEVYRQAGLQGQLGALDRQEAANLSAIERQKANIESGYASDVAAAEADVESQAMQALINQWNQNRQYELQKAQLTGNLGDSRTLAGQEFDYSKSSSNPSVQASILANKQRELEIAAQEIQNSYLPDTYKMQAERLAQQVKNGSLDYDIALAQLNQIKAQTKAINKPNPTSSRDNYLNSIYKKLIEGQELTADERDAIGLKTTTTNTLDSKASANNFYSIVAEIDKARNADEAVRVLQANADYLNDSDYRSALNYIDQYFE
jgi:hypothetical protein